MWQRASFWLEPTFVTAACAATAEKTRDASKRLLPPKRTACTRTSSCSRLLAPLSRRGLRTASQAPCSCDRGTGGFHDLRDRFGGYALRHYSRSLLSRDLEKRAWAFSSHGAELRSSLWHPCRRTSFIFRLARLRVRCVFADGPSLEGVGRVGRCEAGQDRRLRCFVKSLASFRSRMPSTGRDPS